MAIVPTAADIAIKKANLTTLVTEFSKRASKGRRCTYFNEATNERYPTHYTIDKDVKNLIILSPKNDERPLAVCSFAQIVDVCSMAQKTWEPGLKALFTKMSILERDLLAMVLHRDKAQGGGLLRVCLFIESQEARDEFLICIRVLSVYAKTLLQNQTDTTPSADLGSFLSCLACRCGSSHTAHSIMHGKHLVDGIDTRFQIYLPQHYHLGGEVDEDEIGEIQHRVDEDGRIHVIWLSDDREIRSARLLDGVLPGDVVYSEIDLARKNGQRIRKGDEGIVIGSSPDHRGVNVSFATMDNVNMLRGQFAIKQHDDSQKEPPLGEIEETVPSYSDTGARDTFNIAVMCLNKKAKTTAVLTYNPLKHMNLFVADGSRVEYFSTTHKNWCLATVRAEIASDNSWGVTYSAVLANDQERKNSMHVMRRPFVSDDFVEVFLNRATVFNRGSYVQVVEDDEPAEWFAGRISSSPQKHATRSGYPVRLDRSDEILGAVPSWRIRQRYPRGQHVYVYRGLEEGWSPGVVDESASEDGLGATPCKVGAFEHTQDAVKPMKILDMRDKERERKEKRHRYIDKMMMEETGDSRPSASNSEIEPWVFVPVVLDATGHHEEFPSYLVRRCVQTNPGLRLSQQVISITC